MGKGVGDGRAYDGRLMRRLLGYLGPHRSLVWWGLLFLAGASLSELLAPYIIKVAIDDHVAVGDVQGLSRVGALYLLAVIGAAVLRYAQSVTTQKMGQKAMFDLRQEIFRRLQELPLSFYDRQPVGLLMTRVTNDVEVLNEMFSSGVVTVLGDLLILLGIVVAMFLLDVRLALVTMAILPVLTLATWFFRKRMRASYREVRRRLARLNAFLQENLTGIGVVQAFGQETTHRHRFRRLNQDYLSAFLRTIFYFALFFPTVELIGALAVADIVWYGGGEVVRGAVSLGVLVAFIQYVERFFRPVRDLSEKYNIMQSAMAASERIFALLDTPGERTVKRMPPMKRDAGVKGEVVFEKVSFAYREGEPVLREVDFRVRPGEKVALVGATGAGKTTVASLLLGFYPVTSGTVRVEGLDVDEWDLRQLRRRIGLILQDPFLRSGTVWENLVFGCPDATPDQVEKAVRTARADRVLARLPRGYETEVLEGGANFSVGEKQLLSFARLLVCDPRILILDEATSSVDAETESLIQEGIVGLLAGRTSIVIAHRWSTIQHADRVLVFHRGELREEGTHRELMKKRGIYYRLSCIRYGEDTLHEVSGEEWGRN